MHLHFQNVNDAFKGLVKGLNNGTIPARQTNSRNGDVLRCSEPMTITYYNPKQRVLLNRQRDCNPFFHLFESLWMLAGRNDVAPLAYYNSNIANYSDNGETFHGAYGHRWRNHFGWDQVSEICKELKENPESRRCVLQIWDSCCCDKIPHTMLHDFWTATHDGKDVPCNTQAYFEIETEVGELQPFDSNEDHTIKIPRLNMTVTNRSNDMVWGMLGANVVHFSMLQEYMAACIGVDVGVHNQFTNNLHVYKDKWTPKKWLLEYQRTMHSPKELNYSNFKHFVPLVSDPKMFDAECKGFIDNATDPVSNWCEPFLQKVAAPMCWAFRLHKLREYARALSALELVESDDWRTMGEIWIQKRKENWEKKNAKTQS